MILFTSFKRNFQTDPFCYCFVKDKFIIKKFLDINRKRYYYLVIDKNYDRACQRTWNLRYKKLREKFRIYNLL